MGGGGKTNEGQGNLTSNEYTGPERRKQGDRRANQRRTKSRRERARRIDEERAAGIGEIMDDRRSRDRDRDRRHEDRRYMNRRKSDSGSSFGRRATDAGNSPRRPKHQ